MCVEWACPKNMLWVLEYVHIFGILCLLDKHSEVKLNKVLIYVNILITIY